MAGQFSEKEDSLLRNFLFQLIREMSKTKRKSPDKMCELILWKIYPQKMKQ